MAIGNISGKINTPIFLIKYSGETTSTAEVNVNNDDNTIAVNVNIENVTADCAKQKDLDSLKDTVGSLSSSVDTLNSELSKETSERKDADALLQSNLDEESSRALAAENLVQSNLEAEINRAKEAEENINNDLHTNFVDLASEQTVTGVKHFKAGNTSTENIVVYENDTILEKIATFKAGINIDVSAYGNYDINSSTDKKVLTTKQYVDGEVTTLFDTINGETDRATKKENELSSSIDTLNADLLQEIEDRETKDTELETKISKIESSYIKKDGSVSMTGNLNLNNNKIINLKDPESDTDAVNKKFLNTSISTAQSSLESKITTEISNRQTEDSKLQSQIDAITSSSDVVDVVATKAALNSYDKSKLTDKDIVKVLKDESQNYKTTYYRFDKSTSSFTLIGEVGPYYTQSEVDTKINSVSSNLTQEITNRETQYNSLNNKIEGEISNRKTKDTELQNQITTNKSDITNLKTEVADKVSKTTTINNKPLSSNISLDKDDIGLSNVDNTADKDKSVASSVNAQKLVDSTSSYLNVGATNKPIYFKDGVPTIGSYELNTNVPSNAVFIDTTYTLSADVDNNKIKLTPSTGNEQSITVPFATKASKDSSNNDITTTYATKKELSNGLENKQDEITIDNKLSNSLVDGLSKVATSGSYTDLSNTPDIPTKTSDLSNDSEYINKTELNSSLSTKQDTLESGKNIKTINGESLLGSTDIKITDTIYTLKQDSTDGHKISLEDSSGISQSVTIPDENTWRPVEDNLTSTSTTNSLSANQGKVLKELVDTKITKEQANAFISLEDIEGEEGKVLSIVTIQ